MHEKIPESVAIVALGPSKAEYVSTAAGFGDPHHAFDEVWAINAAATVVRCDLMFHMDDVRIQERRAEIAPNGTIANMLNWMKNSPVPIMSSRTHPDYPQIVELPIEKIFQEIDMDYFNSTAAWALGYALAIGVKRIALFGFDFTYPKMEKAERGRACVEYLLGWARAKGVQIKLPNHTTVMDVMLTRQERLYGYDTRKVNIENTSGGVKVSFEDIDESEWPTGEEINVRYDHTQHPNELIRRGIS